MNQLEYDNKYFQIQTREGNIVFNLQTYKIKLLKLVFLEGITHGFNLSIVHRYHPHTHEPLIGPECGEFLKNKKIVWPKN